MKRVQLAGSDTAIEQVLVGLERELRVDISNDSLRLHDGVKEGGYEFLNRDQSDTRYQARSLELDGFNFGAQEKGILTRVAPANYKLRKVIVDENNLSILNPRGTAGDFAFALLPTILSDHTFSGDITFVEPINAQGGVIGDLTGDVTGNLTGNVTGNVTGNLEGDAHGNHTGTFTGDVDVRTFTIQFDDGQIPEAAIDPQAFINRGVPRGAIIMWSGLEEEIPATWVLCDGNNGTPDLRNRFIIGAGGGGIGEGAVGGTDTYTLSGSIANGGEHSHDVTVGGHALTLNEMPLHKHGNGCIDGGGPAFNHGGFPATGGTQRLQTEGSGGNTEGWTTEDGGGASHSHEGSATTTGGAHTHDITLDDATILPPYYALCFIMKSV